MWTIFSRTTTPPRMCVMWMMVTRGRGGRWAIKALAQAMIARARRLRSRTFASNAASAGEVFAALRLPRGAPTFAAPGRGWFLPQFGVGSAT